MSLNLSEHFTIDEAVVTEVRGVNNYPDKGTIAVMGYTASCMEAVRSILKQPIHVNSWYRSLEVNKRVGGAKKSAHMEGRAVDFICPAFGSPLEICREIEKHKLDLRFDQLIFEHTWVHIAFAIPPVMPRLEVLTLQPDGSYKDGIIFTSIKGAQK